MKRRIKLMSKQTKSSTKKKLKNSKKKLIKKDEWAEIRNKINIFGDIDN